LLTVAAELPLSHLVVIGLVVVAALIAVVLVLSVFRRRPPFPFETKPVLTEAELVFHRALAECVPNDTILLAKVRLADFLDVTARGDEFMRHFAKISQKHSDFLIIDAATSEPLLSIELDDSSHRRSRRTMDSDAFKNAVYEAVGIPILRVPARKEYDTRDLGEQVTTALELERAPASPRGADLFETLR